jgi:flagellin-like hook-associated protein FlgL
MRVTTNMIINTVSRNLALSQARFLRLQTMASSGRRINKPSDDPIGITKDLGLRSALSDILQFRKNIDQAASWLTFSDQALSNINELIIDAKEVTVQLANDTYDAAAREGGAVQIRDLFDQIIDAANTRFEGNYIFSGTRTNSRPFLVTPIGVVYQGDYSSISLEAESSSYLSINSIGANFLTNAVRTLGDGHDLNPGLQSNLWLDYLHDGEGVDLGAGQFTIRTLNGEYNVDVSAARNVQDILDAINGLGIPNFTASISNAISGFCLEDTTEYHITTDTPLGMLNKGLGVDQTGTIRFTTGGGTTVDVDVSAATNLGDVINEINTQLAAGGINNVTASVDPEENRLVIIDANLVPLNISISEGTPGSQTASDLGLIGEVVTIFEGGDLSAYSIQVVESAPGENTAETLGLLGGTSYNIMEGGDLDPQLAYLTLLSALNHGQGFPLGKFMIANGDDQQDIDLTPLANDPNATIMDVINLINASGIDVEARINEQETGLILFSNVEGRTLTVVEADGGRTAKDLGIFGSPDLLGNMIVLEDALERNNTEEINICLETFDGALDRILIERSDVGARINRGETASYRLLSFELQVTDQLSKVEDADITRVITDIASAEAAYQAALASAARILQPSLLNFLS